MVEERTVRKVKSASCSFGRCPFRLGGKEAYRALYGLPLDGYLIDSRYLTTGSLCEASTEVSHTILPGEVNNGLAGVEAARTGRRENCPR